MAKLIKKSTPKWDAELNLGACDRYNNYDLTIILKLCLRKIDPPGGAAEGTHPDHDGTQRKIVKWGGKWRTWTTRFRRECEKFWHGKLWLKCPTGLAKYDFSDRGVKYRPNAWCRFRLKLVTSPGVAHHTIDCVRLHKSVPFFRSNATLYDHRDITPKPQSHGSPKKTHLHEVGHLLGLPHVGVGKPITVGGVLCSLHQAFGGSTNDNQCYGLLDDEKKDVMGSGSEIRAWHAKPWQEAAQLFSGAGQSQWLSVLQRHYPRTLDEVKRGVWLKTRPRR